MINKDWNPELYLKYKSERTQPSKDLVARINLPNPQSIIDMGCGPGNSTQVLVERWKQSKIVGVDKSPSMIEKAKQDYPDQEWKVVDVGMDKIIEKYDLVFSNATLQWIPDHKNLLKNLWEIVKPGGAIAAQIPLYHLMPVSKLIDVVANESEWKDRLKESIGKLTILEPDNYYDILAALTSEIDLWETDYFHIMDSHESIIEMIRLTGLKPFLDKLETDKEKNEFERQATKKVSLAYPPQKNNKVLFPFKRLFFIAYKN